MRGHECGVVFIVLQLLHYSEPAPQPRHGQANRSPGWPGLMGRLDRHLARKENTIMNMRAHMKPGTLVLSCHRSIDTDPSEYGNEPEVERVRAALHLVGGRGGGAWQGRADADDRRAAEYMLQDDGYDPDEEYGAGYVVNANLSPSPSEGTAAGGSGGAKKRGKDAAVESAGTSIVQAIPGTMRFQEIHSQTISESQAASQNPPHGAGGKGWGAGRRDTLRPATDSSSSSLDDEWAKRENMPMRRRKEEDQRLIKEFGGDLSVLTAEPSALRPRSSWGQEGCVGASEVVSHAARKRREEAQAVEAAGGGLEEIWARPKPSQFERDKQQWQAAEAGVEAGLNSVKERRKKEEEEIIRSFGGDLTAASSPLVSSRDRNRLLQQESDTDVEWERTSTGDTNNTVLSFKERKWMEEEALKKGFGGELDTCVVKQESLLEREKREAREKRESKLAKKQARATQKAQDLEKSATNSPSVPSAVL